MREYRFGSISEWYRDNPQFLNTHGNYSETLIAPVSACSPLSESSYRFYEAFFDPTVW
jgi:hypothetical protein